MAAAGRDAGLEFLVFTLAPLAGDRSALGSAGRREAAPRREGARGGG